MYTTVVWTEGKALGKPTFPYPVWKVLLRTNSTKASSSQTNYCTKLLKFTRGKKKSSVENLLSVAKECVGY